MAKQSVPPVSFETQLDKLSKELNLSARWGMPSTLLAVYESSLTGAKIVSDLEARLTRQGQYVCHITPDIEGKNSIIDEITRNNHWDETVFFIMHLGRGTEENIYSVLNAHNDFFINNQIRVVYWLTKPDLIAYVQNSPEHWFSQHKLVEFSSSSGLGYVLPKIIKRTWQNFDGLESDQIQKLENVSLTQLLSLDIRDDLDGLVERAHILIKLGLFYFRQKDYPRALQFLSKAVEIAAIIEDDGFSAASQIAFALVQTGLNQYDDAISLQEKIESVFPKSEDVWNSLASLYFALFMFDEAFLAYQTSLSISNENPISWQGLGEVHLQFGQLDKAIDAFHKSVLVAPNFACAWKGLGKAYTAAGNHVKAVECYTKSLEINYRQASVWFEIGRIAEDDIAQSALQYSLDLDQTQAFAWNLLGNIYYRAGKFNKAIRAYYKAIQLKKDFGWPYANMALIYTKRKQYENAILLYIKSSHLFQNDLEKANVLYKRGNAYRDSGEHGNAVGAYREAAKLHKGSSLLDKNLVAPGPFRDWVSAPKGDERLSEENKRDEEPTEEAGASTPVRIIEEAQLRKSNKNTILRKILETNKKAATVDYWLELGEYYVRSRMYEFAEDAFLIATELDPSNGWPYYNLALTNTVNGLYRNAVPLYEKSIRLFDERKDKALSWNQLGNVYRRLNEPSLAVAAYENARVLEPPPKSSIVSRARLSLMSNCYAK